MAEGEREVVRYVCADGPKAHLLGTVHATPEGYVLRTHAAVKRSPR